MKKISKHRIVLVLVAVIVFIAIYFTYNPLSSNLFPKCIFLSLTGWQCPGCGSQRAIHYLLHFDVVAAFMVNPLLIVSIPYLAVAMYLEYLGGKDKYPRLRNALIGYNATIIVGIIVVSFWIGRNIF